MGKIIVNGFLVGIDKISLILLNLKIIVAVFIFTHLFYFFRCLFFLLIINVGGFDFVLSGYYTNE